MFISILPTCHFSNKGNASQSSNILMVILYAAIYSFSVGNLPQNSNVRLKHGDDDVVVEANILDNQHYCFLKLVSLTENLQHVHDVPNGGIRNWGFSFSNPYNRCTADTTLYNSRTLKSKYGKINIYKNKTKHVFVSNFSNIIMILQGMIL